MPRKNNPNDLVLGTGQAAQNSVSASALISVNFSTAPDIDVTAAQISVDTPLAVSGNNVQLHVDGISGLSPRPLPPTLNTVYSSNDFVVTPVPKVGVIAGTNTVVLVVPTNTLTFNFVLFPADRGVLSVDFDPTLTGAGYQSVQALDLSVVFVDGSPQADTAPSRRVGQLDYVSGSNLAASLGFLPQNTSLVDRLPRSEDYARANFPFLAPGVNPVYPAYSEGFTGQQIARTSIQMTFGVGQNGRVRVVQYKSRADFQRAQSNLVFQSWANVDFSASVGFFLDTTAVPVVVTGYTFTPNNTANSAAVGLNRRFLSGILHYAPNDTFNVSWNGTGLYANTYSFEGAEIQRVSGDTIAPTPIFYTDYTVSPTPLASDVSSYTNAAFIFSNGAGGVRLARPVVRASKPNGFSNSSTYFGSTILVHEGSFLAPSFTEETFNTERARYDYLDDAELPYYPTGQDSNWDATITIANRTELQVRALDVTNRLNLGYGGGELTWPEFNYGLGHFPTTKNGVAPQENYSVGGLTVFPERGYVRAFDAGSPRREGRLRIDGTFKISTYVSLLEMLMDVSGSGIEIALAASGANLVYYSSILRPLYAGGIYTEIEEISPNSVVISYLLPHTPHLIGGFYPVTLQLEITSGSQATTGGANFGVQRLLMLPPL